MTEDNGFEFPHRVWEAKASRLLYNPLVEKVREVNLVLGCGERGMDWSPRTLSNCLMVPLDQQSFSCPSPNFVTGDVLHLPFANRSVDRIFADFILNSVEIKGATMRDAIASPQVLEGRYCPEEVRRWYTETLGRSAEKFDRNKETLRWILREVALQEMWRVIKEGGSITIVDHGHVVNWLRAKIKEVPHRNGEGIELRIPALSPEDYKRSASPEKFSRSGARIGKAVLRKTPAQLGLTFEEQLQQLSFGKIFSY